MARRNRTIEAIQRDLTRQRFEQSGITRRKVEADLKKTTKQPKGIELSYSAFLVSGQRKINAEIKKRLAAIVSILDVGRRIDSVHTDDLSDDIVTAFQALRETIQKLAGATGGVLRIGITNHGVKTLQFNDKKYFSPTMRLLGIGNASASVERSILKGWVFENTALITNMNAEQLGKLETLFLRALRDGSRSAQIQADVAAVVDGNVNRARLIARDQIGKLNGQLDRQKQTEAGLDSYIWRGALDEREREEHVAREGKVFKWAHGPADGHPGQPVQCRCSGEPNLQPLLGKEFAAEPRSASDFSKATPEKRRENRRIQAAKRRRRARRQARQSAAA